MTSPHVWFELVTTFLCIFIASLSSSSLLVIHPICFTPLLFFYTDLFQVWYFLCIIFAYLIISLICFIVSLLILYLHWAPLGPWLMSFSIHVAFYTWGHGFLIIGYLSLVSFHFYYPISLHYVLCLKTILRPWDQMSSSTASTLTGIWDLVDIWISSYFFF